MRLILSAIRSLVPLLIMIGACTLPDWYTAESAFAFLPHPEPVKHAPFLALASAAGEIDWTVGTVRVTGVGMAPANIENQTIRREMAKRAALADGERKFLNAVAEIRLGADGTVQSWMGRGNFTRKIGGYVKGFRVIRERDTGNGGIEIDLELPLAGEHGLSQYLFE